jgi:F-type H+-transporting ATPase subunit epsilon
MSGFEVHLQSATQYERLENVVSFVGEDRSGSFGLLRGHARFVTTLVLGLARLRYADNRRDYLALPGAVAYFNEDRLYLSCRRYLRGDDYTRISAALREELVREEEALGELKRSLEQMEHAMLRWLWRLRRGEERG